MQKFNASSLEQFMKDVQDPVKSKHLKGGVISIRLDEDENIIDAYKQQENVLPEVTDALKKTVNYLHCIHIMTRVTLYEGF